MPSSSNAVLLRQPLSEGGPSSLLGLCSMLHCYVPHGRVPCVIRVVLFLQPVVAEKMPKGHGSERDPNGSCSGMRKHYEEYQ